MGCIFTSTGPVPLPRTASDGYTPSKPAAGIQIIPRRGQLVDDMPLGELRPRKDDQRRKAAHGMHLTTYQRRGARRRFSQHSTTPGQVCGSVRDLSNHVDEQRTSNRASWRDAAETIVIVTAGRTTGKQRRRVGVARHLATSSLAHSLPHH